MGDLTTPQSSIFAANRATGHIGLSVAAHGGRTHRRAVHEHGSLRVRFPNAADTALEAVIVNTGGGMTGGDRFSIDLTLEPGAHLLAGTAAAEKIYRSTGPDVDMTVGLSVAAGASLVWLPQETILFDRARLSRRIDIDLAEGASLLAAEAVVFGRAAMGEAMAQGFFADRWRVRRGGRLVYADSTRLDGGIAARLGAAAVASGGIAVATLLLVPSGDDTLAALRAVGDDLSGEAGVSSWNGVTVMRFCARDGATLRRDLVAALAALRQPVPRLWIN